MLFTHIHSNVHIHHNKGTMEDLLHDAQLIFSFKFTVNKILRFTTVASILNNHNALLLYCSFGYDTFRNMMTDDKCEKC